MSALAALSVGAFCALLAGALAGALPSARTTARPRVRRDAAELWLQQAGALVSPRQFALGSAGAALVALLLLQTMTGSVFVALVPAGAVALLPRGYFGRRRRVRMQSVQSAWPDGLRDILASITAGRSLTQAVAALAATGPEPLRDAFRGFPELARVLGTGAALEIVKEEMADPTSDRVLEVLVLAHERGGAIVRTILEDLVDATTRDLKLRDELETEGLEMRINARVVVILPWLVLVALTARPGPFRAFYQTGGGVLTLIIAGGLTVVGVVALGRLGHDPTEARVFPGRRTTV